LLLVLALLHIESHIRLTQRRSIILFLSTPNFLA
jgi:hypothetical protein